MGLLCLLMMICFISSQLSAESVSRKQRSSRRPAAGERSHSWYRVKSRDTLYRISNRFKVSQDDLCRINHINNRCSIKAGTLLKIPALPSTSKEKRNTVSKIADDASSRTSDPHPAFIWPIRNIVHCSSEQMRGVKSIGITITGRPGASVLSSASGVVRRVGYMRGYGNYVVISHRERYATVYANLGKILVTEGERIRSGIPIARIEGNDTDLHFQIDHEGRPKDPLKFLPKRS